MPIGPCRIRTLHASRQLGQARSGSIEGRWRSPGGNSIIDIAAERHPPVRNRRLGSSAKAKSRPPRPDRPAGRHPALTGPHGPSEARAAWEGQLFIPDKNMRVLTAQIYLEWQRRSSVSGSGAAIGRWALAAVEAGDGLPEG